MIVIDLTTKKLQVYLVFAKKHGEKLDDGSRKCYMWVPMKPMIFKHHTPDEVQDFQNQTPNIKIEDVKEGVDYKFECINNHPRWFMAILQSDQEELDNLHKAVYEARNLLYPVSLHLQHYYEEALGKPLFQVIDEMSIMRVEQS